MTKGEHCISCNRTKLFWDGCSHIECPERKPITAQPVGEPFATYAKSGQDIKKPYENSSGDGIRREPTSKE